MGGGGTIEREGFILEDEVGVEAIDVFGGHLWVLGGWNGIGNWKLEVESVMENQPC